VRQKEDYQEFVISEASGLFSRIPEEVVRKTAQDAAMLYDDHQTHKTRDILLRERELHENVVFRRIVPLLSEPWRKIFGEAIATSQGTQAYAPPTVSSPHEESLPPSGAPSLAHDGEMSRSSEQWSAEYGELTGCNRRGTFTRFPGALRQTCQDPSVFMEPFLNLRANLPFKGTITGRVLTDCRYRLIQLHQIVHTFHSQFRQATYSMLKSYLIHSLDEGNLPKGNCVYVPVLFPGRPPNLFLRLGCRVIAKRLDSYIALQRVPQSALATAIVLSQCDELFADFFAAAASGAAYWSTMADLEVEGTSNVESMLEGSWDLNYTQLWEPYPVPWLRIRYFPRLFAETFGGSVLIPSPGHLYVIMTDLSQHYQERVLPRLPSMPKNVRIVYSSHSEDFGVGRIELGLDFMLRFYRAAFIAFTVLMNEWCLSGHPLQGLTLLFNVKHHFRIKDLAHQFATSEPTPVEPFDAVCGAAAARLAYDWGMVPDLDVLQQRAAGFLRRCKGATMLIPVISEAN
jgi:hypothetical protein